MNRTPPRRSGLMLPSQWSQSFNMVAGKILKEGLGPGEAQAAAQALGNVYQLRACPVALQAAGRAGQILVIGPRDQPAGPALGTDHLLLTQEGLNQADVSAGEVMDELVAGDVYPPAVGTDGPEGGQAVAAGA